MTKAIDLLIGILRRLPEAVRKAFPFMLLGILFALLLEAASKSLGAYSDSRIFSAFAVFFHELSVGFFVSSIAVLFFEWGSHAKAALDLNRQLQALVESGGMDAVDKGMGIVFSTQPKLCDAHKRFVRELRDLNQSERWGKADVEFLSLFVEQAADHAARLQNLRRSMTFKENDPGPELLIDFSKTADFAPKILTAHMGLLAKGEAYDTVSNPKTWSALRVGFFDACMAAVEKGVTMRRIFIMQPMEEDHYTADDVLNLYRHYRRANNGTPNQNGGSYCIHFAEPKIFQDFDVEANNRHYGIFRYKPGAVAFIVVGRDVANFKLLAVPAGHHLSVAFNLMWQHLEYWKPRTPSERSSRFLDEVLSREVRHLQERGARLEIVSTPDSWKAWQTRALPKLTAALQQLEIRHLFVTKDKEIDEVPTLQEKSLVNSSWWRHECCSIGDVEAITGQAAANLSASDTPFPIPHCRFVIDGRPAHPYIFRLESDENLSNFLIDDGEYASQKAQDYARAFQKLWDKAQSRHVGTAHDTVPSASEPLPRA